MQTPPDTDLRLVTPGPIDSVNARRNLKILNNAVALGTAERERGQHWCADQLSRERGTAT